MPPSPTSPAAEAAAPPSIAALLDAVAQRFRQAGIEAAAADARHLVGAALSLDRAGLLSARNRQPSAAELAAIEPLVLRRLDREPVSRILGRREFWSLDFHIDGSVLDPRPDTETVVQGVLDHVVDRHARYTVLDLGTGSGCLLLALLSELPASEGIGVDIRHDAAVCARHNARRLGFADRARFIVGNWGSAVLGENVHIMVTNPPYVSGHELRTLMPEVAQHDPRVALDGGEDGLDAYRALAPQIVRVLRPGGLAAVEVGRGQASAVVDLLAKCGLAIAEVKADLAGVGRCVVAQNRVGMRSETG